MKSLHRNTLSTAGLIVLGLLLLGLLIPTKDFVCPAWTVFVTDTAGQPLSDVTVTASTQQYTLESNDVEQTRNTDANGRVQFAQRVVRANALRRLLGVFINVLGQGAHASFGTHTNVYAHRPGYGDPSDLKLFGANEIASRATGEKTKVSHIVLLKCPIGYNGFGCDFQDDPSQPIKPLDLGKRPDQSGPKN